MKFLFDFLSPYAYIAWHRVKPIAAAHGRALEPVPVLLAGLLGAHGTKGPAEVVAKRPFLVKDTARAAAAAGVPFGPPPSHPFNPLLALRVTGCVTDIATRARLVDALYAEVWGGRGRGVTDPTVVASIASSIGLDGPALVAAASSDDAKSRLRSATESAIAANVFGVPTILVDGELFWGNDNIEYLDAFLSGRDPVTSDYLAQWTHVRPSASR
jgi:2-hydroxychromene-2-carboxylate isomerase